MILWKWIELTLIWAVELSLWICIFAFWLWIVMGTSKKLTSLRNLIIIVQLTTTLLFQIPRCYSFYYFLIPSLCHKMHVFTIYFVTFSLKRVVLYDIFFDTPKYSKTSKMNFYHSLNVFIRCVRIHLIYYLECQMT